MEANPIALFRRLVRLWALYARMDAGWFLRDTKYCLVNILTDVISGLTAMSGVFLLAARFGGVGSMSRDQVLFLLGYGALVDGVFTLCFMMCNVGHISRRIGRGQVDHMLIQPLPLWAQLVTEGFIPVSGSSMLLCGAALTAVAAARLHVAVTALWLGRLAFDLVCSEAVVLAFSYLLGSMAFYAPVAAEEISTSAVNLFSIKGYPLGGLPQRVRLALSTALPIGLAAWLPACDLMGVPAGVPVILLPAAAVVLSVAAALFFRKGLKHYATTGCPRYLDFGHRR